MKIKKTNLLMLILITTIIVFSITTKVFATISPNFYKPNELQEEEVSSFEQFGGRIAGVIQLVGTIISVGAIMIIGIRYMVSSAEEKAEYKERMMPYLIGAVLLFGASNIVNIIYNIF